MYRATFFAVLAGTVTVASHAHALSIGADETVSFAYNYEVDTDGDPVLISSPYTLVSFNGNFFSNADDFDYGNILQSDEDLVFKLFNDAGEQWFEGSIRDRIGTSEGVGTSPSNFSIGFTLNDAPWDGFFDTDKSSQIGTLELSVAGLFGEQDPFVNITQFGMDFRGTLPSGSLRSTDFSEQGSFIGLSLITDTPTDPLLPTAAPVPLPPTAALMLLGIGLLGGVRRRRNR